MPWIEIGCSLLASAICIPLVLGKVPRNHFYGMRSTRTMNGTDENWYTTNRIVGRTMMLTSLLSAAVDVGLAFLPLPTLAIYVASMIILLAAILAPVVIHRKLLF